MRFIMLDDLFILNHKKKHSNWLKVNAINILLLQIAEEYIMNYTQEMLELSKFPSIIGLIKRRTHNLSMFTHITIKECDNMDKENVPPEKRMFMNLSSKDKPDMVDSDTISIFDLHEDMQTVDIIPIEELNKRVKREGDELIEMQPDEL